MKGLQHAPCHVVVVHTEGLVTGGGEMMRIGDIDAVRPTRQSRACPMRDITRRAKFTYTRDMLLPTTLLPTYLRVRWHSAVWSANRRNSTSMHLHVPQQRTVRPTHCMSGPPPDQAPRRAHQRLTAGHVNNLDPDSTPHTSASSLQSAMEAAYAQCQSGSHWLPDRLRAQLWTHASFAPRNTVTLADIHV
jgi:hypothetical protein